MDLKQEFQCLDARIRPLYTEAAKYFLMRKGDNELAKMLSEYSGRPYGACKIYVNTSLSFVEVFALGVKLQDMKSIVDKFPSLCSNDDRGIREDATLNKGHTVRR